jgi:hypothetical protein
LPLECGLRSRCEQMMGLLERATGSRCWRSGGLQQQYQNSTGSFNTTAFPFFLMLLDAPATTSSITYSVGTSANVTGAFRMRLMEIMGALQPANDDEQLTMTG